MSLQTHRLEDQAATSPGDPDARAGHAGWDATSAIGLGVALVCSLYVFWLLHPELLLANTTPSGGDMGAHVWAPAFLRDHLLPAGRLSGWTPDWYAGFPAFHFYMVIPSLAIVALNVGLSSLFVAIPAAIAVVAAAVVAGRRFGHLAWWVVPAVLVALVLIPIPYGISFKLVSVSGVVTFPVAAWAMGRLARAPEPVPPFLAVASLFFLFDTNFSIYGGNIASTLAGEFAFSISLSLTLVALGLAVRGMDSGRGRVVAALVIGLVALTHVIPVFFAMTALFVLIVLSPAVPRMWPLALGVAIGLIPISIAEERPLWVAVLAVVAASVTLGAVVVAEPEVRSRFWWLAVTGPVAALLSAFWLLPFYLREPYFNDMGWERLNEVGPALLTVPMKVALPVAAVGFVLAVAQRERIGQLFAISGLVFAAAVANLPESALWNARLLPFFYLSTYLVAAVGAALVARAAAVAVAEDFRRPSPPILVAATLAAVVGGLVAVSMPLRVMPFGETRPDGSYQWLAFTNQARSFIPSWAAWNYSGYERKNSYREYRDVVLSMEQVGSANGCGRAMWEYSSDLDRYGTPMALMLLPHWTDGCIGSMEGLYFESSSTTPFHFLNQSVLSQAPSRAQRDLPYLGYDINRGVEQLQIMGVRYYMAQTDESISAARSNPDLTEIAEAQPFVVFEVAGSELVEALPFAPVVVSGRSEAEAGPEAHRFDIGWLSEAVDFYNNPSSFEAIPAEDGPAGWSRQVDLPTVGEQPVSPITVSNIESDTSTISFQVDEVGTPVLVKTSFFPNWEATGADGPFRAGPNLMVVVPTDNEVTLSYGRTAVDWLGVGVTGVGLLGLVVLGRLDRPGAGLLRRRRDENGELETPSTFDDEELGSWLAEERSSAAGVDTVDGGRELVTAAHPAPVTAELRQTVARRGTVETGRGAEGADAPTERGAEAGAAGAADTGESSSTDGFGQATVEVAVPIDGGPGSGADATAEADPEPADGSADEFDPADLDAGLEAPAERPEPTPDTVPASLGASDGDGDGQMFELREPGSAGEGAGGDEPEPGTPWAAPR